jgi:hypothetical protein
MFSDRFWAVTITSATVPAEGAASAACDPVAQPAANPMTAVAAPPSSAARVKPDRIISALSCIARLSFASSDRRRDDTELLRSVTTTGGESRASAMICAAVVQFCTTQDG